MRKILSTIALALAITTAANAQQTMDFTMDDTHGNEWTLYDVLGNGNAVILDFFATWCGPCKSSTPALQGIWEDYGKGAGALYIFGIDVDMSETDAMVDAFKLVYGPNADYPGFAQQQCGTLWSFYNGLYGSGGIPMFLLINPDPANPTDPTKATVDWNQVGWAASVETALRAKLHTSTVGIKEIKSVENINIYPNPAVDNATIEFNVSESENIAINILDVTGKIVSQIGNTTYSTGFQKINVDVSNLNNGLYYVNIVSDNGVITNRLMINR